MDESQMGKADSDHVQKEGRFETRMSFCLRKFTVARTCPVSSQTSSIVVAFSVNVHYGFPHPQM